MTNWFAGIGAAASGLDAARYGLSVVSQNMTNASTPGYTRQVAQQSEVGLGNVSSLYARPRSGLDGVSVSGTSRRTDPVLDARVRSEHARGALADTTAAQAAQVESVFPEPSSSGLAGQLSAFWADWGTLANNPGSAATRAVVLQDANGLAGTLNSMSQQLGAVVTATSQSLGNDVTAANTAAGQLSTLNGQIAIGNATGQDVNPLLDQRDSLLQTLSSLVGASATIGADGAATVTVGGQTLVSGVTAATISTDAAYSVSVGGTAVAVTLGSVAAETTALTSTLPGYQGQLDAVADALSSTVNGAQAAGYDQSGAAGTAIFAGSGAAGIHVVLTSGAGVAASGTPGGNLDGSNALGASQTGTLAASPDALYASLVGAVASAGALAKQQASTQDAVVSNLDSMKASVSGVSLDEEASSMLVYQQAFNASSRVLTTLDSMLDTLINHTGLVGMA